MKQSAQSGIEKVYCRIHEAERQLIYGNAYY